MDNSIANLITKWHSELGIGISFNYEYKKEIFKSIVEELAEYQSCFGVNIWDITILGAFVRNLLAFKISNNIVVEKKDVSEFAAKVLEHLSEMENNNIFYNFGK